MKCISRLDKYAAIFRLTVANRFAYSTEVFFQALHIGLVLFVIALMWKLLFAGKTTISGFTLAQMIWYILFGELIVTSQQGVVEEVVDDIRSGNIANYLNKPYSYTLYKYVSTMGSGIFNGAFTLIVGGIVVSLTVGSLHPSLVQVAAIPLLVILAMTISFLLLFSIGLLSFWMEDSKGIEFVYTKTVFILGGMLLPLSLLPSWLQTIATKLPTAAIAYFPARTSVLFSATSLVHTLLLQFFWIIVCTLLCMTLFKLGKQKVEVNGG